MPSKRIQVRRFLLAVNPAAKCSKMSQFGTLVEKTETENVPEVLKVPRVMNSRLKQSRDRKAA